MSCYGSGFGLYGAGSNGGVTAELLSLGAMDAFLIRGAECTFWRFRYCRHTNFAMEAVGQNFNNQPQFGGHSSVSLDRSGDLIYFMYVVIDLPSIYAEFDNCNNNRSCDSHSGCGANQFPSACGQCHDKSDRKAFRRYATDYDCQDSDDSNLTDKGHAAWMKNNYDGCYDPNECSDNDCQSVPDNCQKPWCHWSNAIGQLLISRAILVVGGHQTDILYSDYLFMWEELSGLAGKRLKEMIGKRKSRKQLIKDARKSQRFYVPLPFYFALTSGNALAFTTIYFHGVQVHIEWEKLTKCVVVSHRGVRVYKSIDGTKLSNGDLHAWIDTTYVHLDIAERNKFSMANFDQLMTQVQLFTIPANNDVVNVPINFNHPTIELIWAVRRRCEEQKNNHFNFSGIDGMDPILEVQLKLNNMIRFSGREGRYYRTVQPYQHHKSLPKGYIYCYSFALFPEDPQPSGSINFSRIDHADMTFMLQPGLGKESPSIIIIGRNWNIMRYTEGLAGPLFNN
jgi:hypothetical protein